MQSLINQKFFYFLHCMNSKVCCKQKSIGRVMVQLQASACESIKLFEMQSDFFHTTWSLFTVHLQCLGSDAIPSRSIHKSSHRKQVTTHSLCWPQVAAESQEKAWWFEVTMSSRCWWGHCNVQGKLCSVASHHTLETSKRLPHVISHTQGTLS